MLAARDTRLVVDIPLGEDGIGRESCAKTAIHQPFQNLQYTQGLHTPTQPP
jgi:hypothetical protein